MVTVAWSGRNQVTVISRVVLFNRPTSYSMKKIKIFLACSNELKVERERFELEIYRKCKAWSEKGIFLHLDVWEDLSARISRTRSQDEYNTIIQDTDLFVLLAFTKVGMYTAEEFESAFGSFKATNKPFIFTYFKENKGITDPSLQAFKNKLAALGHCSANYRDFNDLWNQFNKELERLEKDKFQKNEWSAGQNTSIHVDNACATIKHQSVGGRTIRQGKKSTYIEQPKDITINNL